MESAQRMQLIPAHFFAALSEKLSAMRSQGLDVIRLDEGAPDLPPEPYIIQALSDSAANPAHHSYQPHRGNSALRQAWANMYQAAYSVELDSESEVLPLLGSKEGIFNLAIAMVDPGMSFSCRIRVISLTRAEPSLQAGSRSPFHSLLNGVICLTSRPFPRRGSQDKIVMAQLPE